MTELASRSRNAGERCDPTVSGDASAHRHQAMTWMQRLKEEAADT